MKSKKKTNMAIVLILLLLLLTVGYKSLTTYWVPPNTSGNIVGRYEVFGAEGCSFEVYDRMTDRSYNMDSEWVTSNWNEVVSISTNEQKIKECLGVAYWDKVKPTTTTTIPTTCQSDSDCFWCGDVCRKKEDLVCPTLIPPSDKDCKCVSGTCQAVPKEEFPVVTLALLGGLGFIIIQGKKWLK